MITFTKTGNSIKMDIGGTDITYLPPDTSIFVKVNEGKIYLQSTSNTFLTKSYISFLPIDVNGRPNDDLEDVAEWIRDEYFPGLTLQATGDIDLGDVTIINGTGANAVNIRDGGNSITVDGAVSITDGVTSVEVVPLAGYNAQAVAVVDGSGNQITSFGGGTQYTEGDTDASITGTALLWEDTSDTLRSVSAAKPLPVNIVAGAAAGTEYTEGDVDASISGGAMMMEVAGNTLQPVQGTVADGLLVNLGTNNDVTVSGIPELTVTNAISATAFALGGGAYSATSAVSNDYILDHIQFNFSTTQSRDITITLADGTELWSATGDTSLNIVLEDIDKAFNGGDNFTIAVTQTGGACAMDVLAVVKEGASTIAGDTNVVISGTGDNGRVRVIPVTSEGHLEVAIHSPRLPFGEIEVGELDPVFQSDAVYGINTSEIRATTDGSSGTATAASNLFSVGTGGTVAGYFGTIQSRKRLRYRPGQGIVARFTMLFSTGIANNIQVVGVGTSESTFAFGYNGTSFGILHSTGGVRCINTLTISVGSTANTTATVTLNNVAYNVSVTNSSSATMTAYEISMGTYAGWTAVQRGATVIFLANSSGVKSSTYSVSFGAGTGAGSFPGTPTLVGVASSDVWVPQSSWNGDVCDGSNSTSNPSGFNLVPTYGNVGKIAIQYLGFGAVTFSIEAAAAGNNPDFVNVHTIRFPNSQASVSVSQPSFPFLMSSYNIGATSGAITTKCGSFAGFIAGKKKLTGPRMSYFNTTAVTSSTSAYTPLFTIRNDITYATRANQAIVNLLSVSGATKGNANSITTFYVIKNATLSAGTPNFTSFATTSCTYIDQAATACTFATNDQVIWSTTVTQDGNFIFSFTDEITLQPGETITLAVRSVTATSTCIGQINTREDQ